MRKFLINVNGNKYEVEVEEIKNGEAGQTAPPAPISKPSGQEAAQKAPSAKTDKSVPSGAVKVTAPMPGTILSVNVKNGDKVNQGDVIAILEAMKMENEIVAPQSGTVASVNVEKGASVNSGDVIISIA